MALSAPTTSPGGGRTPLVALTGTASAKLDFLMPAPSFAVRSGPQDGPGAVAPCCYTQ
ncbi:hypothetical protein [Streptomyces sp. NPDC058572]|uniref:hypothetical protein n=1 Tax=Streptomyces sp. NPDC058572 TaxID=3346546 RepID=UPI003660C6CF